MRHGAIAFTLCKTRSAIVDGNGSERNPFGLPSVHICRIP
jgi:hypothetical protein